MLRRSLLEFDDRYVRFFLSVYLVAKAKIDQISDYPFYRKLNT